MKIILPVMLMALALPAAAQSNPASDTDKAVPAYVTNAISDPARKADKADDSRRQMAAVMTFTGVEPGDKVLELVPGSGYWTRMFSAIVGPEGHVYTVWPDEFANESYANWQKLVATPHYANVSLLKQPIAELDVPAQLDLVYTSQNYHDYQNRMDIVAFNIKVYEALKPGGLYVIIDHVASAGSGASDTDTLHRIDPALVRKDVEAAGFVFGGANDALRNRDDPHTVSVFDDSIRGHTDQFIYRFRKPAQ